MTFVLRNVSLAAFAVLALAGAPAAWAQDAMKADAMKPDAMAAAPMAPMTDDEFKLCQEQAGTITFPVVQHVAMKACEGLHDGMDVMGTMNSMGMGMDGGAMAPDAMAPATK